MTDTSDSRIIGPKILFPAVLALILLFMGTALIARGFCLLTHPAQLEYAYWTDIENGDVVLTKDISLIAPLLQTEGDAGRIACCLVGFSDASGDLCLGVLQIAGDDGLYDFYQEYAENTEAPLGSYAVNGYFTAASTDALGGTFLTQYEAACGQYADVLAEFSSEAYNGNVRVTTLCFNYLCRAQDNYLTALGRQDTVSGLIGVVIVVVGAAGIALCAASLIAEHRRRSAV